MNKTNLLLLLVALALGGLSWMSWDADARSAAPASTEEASGGYRRFAVDVPRTGTTPNLDAVRGIRIVPPRVEKSAELDAPSNLEREKLEGELARVIWDLLPPARRAELHGLGSDPNWAGLKAAPVVHALLERCAGLVADAQARLRTPSPSLWGEAEALAADSAMRETVTQFVQGQIVSIAVPRLLMFGFSHLSQIEGAMINMQRGRPAGDASAFKFGELQTQSAQNVRVPLIGALAKIEDTLAPWRRPLRHLERLLGGEPRHGFDGFDEEAWIAEIEERVANLLELASAEAMDHPNPEEFERRRRTVTDALKAVSAKIPAWKERAREIGVERAAVREAFAGLSEAGRTLALDTFPPPQFFPQAQRIGYTLAIARAIQGGLTPEVKEFLVRAKTFAEGGLLAFHMDVRSGVAGLTALPAEVEAMMKTAPREVRLARSEDGAWRVTSEGSFPASGERLDGVEIPPASALRLSPLGGLRMMFDLARAEIARRALKTGGAKPESGPPPLLLALAELLANDPRGAWLPRERDYGFDEHAVEIVLEGEGGKVLDRVRFGAPDAEAANPPPWIEGKRKAELSTRNMAYAHSFNPGRRLAYRVEWMPRLATVRPNQELRTQDLLYGDRRLVPVMSAEAFRLAKVSRGDRVLAIERVDGAAGAPASWTLRSGDAASGAMDEGLARRFLSQITSLFLEGVAAKVDPQAASWKRFGFDAPRLVLTLQSDDLAERLVFGARVRRDGKLYVACTAEGTQLGALTAGARYAFLVEATVFQRLLQGIDEVAEEARLLSAGPILDPNALDAVDRIALSEGASEGEPARSVEVRRNAERRWVVPSAADHPADSQRIEGHDKALLERLRALTRAYPFAGLTDAQRADLAQRLQSGTRISLQAGEGAPIVVELASDADATLGGERLANRRRSGVALQILHKVGEEEFFLVPSLELPDLALGSWLDLQWRRGLEPIKQATILLANGAATGDIDIAVAKDDTGAWRRGDKFVELSRIEEALNWLENLGVIDIAEAPEAEPWLRVTWRAGAEERTLEIFSTGEGDAKAYVARVPGRATSYRASPIVVDALVAAVKKLATE